MFRVSYNCNGRPAGLRWLVLCLKPMKQTSSSFRYRGTAGLKYGALPGLTPSPRGPMVCTTIGQQRDISVPEQGAPLHAGFSDHAGLVRRSR